MRSGRLPCCLFPLAGLLVGLMIVPCFVSAQLFLVQLPKPPPPAELPYSLKIGTVTRDYLLHVPQIHPAHPIHISSHLSETDPEDEPEEPERPLVIYLHGAGGNAGQSAHGLGWEAKADRDNFLVAFPNGAPADPAKPVNVKTNPRIWEDGSFRNKMRRVPLDDGGFLRAMLADIERRYRVDKRRIYVVGFSNGGGMAFRFAAESSDRIAAVACVSCLSWLPRPTPRCSVPLLYLVGTRDPLTPLNGGTVKSAWGTYETKPPVLDTVEKWLRWNGCSPTPSEMKEEGTLRTMRYLPRVANGSEIRFLLVKGMGHYYPGSSSLSSILSPKNAGKPVKRLDGTSLLWDFLKGFTREKS